MIATISKVSFRILAITGIAILLAGCTFDWKSYLQILENIQRHLGAVWNFLVVLCYVFGVFFMAMAIFKLKQYGQMTVMMSTHASMGPSIAYLMVGAGFLYFPSLIDTVLVSLWGYGYDSVLGYPDTGGGFDDVLAPIFSLIQLLGFIAFIRGWIGLSRLGQQGQPGAISKSFINMLGGIAAININGTIAIIKGTLGG